MSEHAIDLNENSFDSTVQHGKWVVDFWAEWCGPCKIMAPHFDSAAQHLKGKAHFAKVNVDENYELADKFQVMSLPTTLFFKDGEVVHAQVGMINKEKIIDIAESVF